MKKTLLSMLAACSVVVASAAVTDLKAVWNANIPGSEGMLWNAPVAVIKAGNLYATGAFDKDVTIAGPMLSPVGTSSYIAKYDVAGTAKWAVAITGAANITAVDADNDGNVYVAGVYADEITFGTTSGDEIVKEGQMVDGAPTAKMNSSFIAKYDANGAVKAVETFVPQAFSALAGMYFPEDGEIFFYINGIKAVNGEVYASATFTGETTKGDAAFISSYDDMLGWGFMFIPLKSASIFKVNSDFTKVTPVVFCGVAEPQAADGETTFEYQAKSVTMTVAEGTVYGAFSGNGPLTLKAEKDTKTVEAAQNEFAYTFVSVSEGSFDKVASVKDAAAEMSKPANVSAIILHGTNASVMGYQQSTVNDVEQFGVFMFSDVFGKAQKVTMELKDGDISYYNISSLTVTPDGTILAAILGYYNNKGEDHSLNDFANKSQAYALMGSKGVPCAGQ